MGLIGPIGLISLIGLIGFRPPFCLPLNLSCLYHQHDALGEAVGAVRVIFFGEAGAEEGGKGLVEACSYGS